MRERERVFATTKIQVAKERKIVVIAKPITNEIMEYFYWMGEQVTNLNY